jgi:hypothetical protein
MEQPLPEPKDLMVSFDDGINSIREREGNNVEHQIRTSWEETFYWPMIETKAGTMAKSHRLQDEFTVEQTQAGTEILQARGLGRSKDMVLKYMAFWKLLFDLRMNGVTWMLVYRTAEFNDYCFKHPDRLETLLSWDKVYHQPISRLQSRCVAQAANDFSGRCDLEDASERATIPANDWGDTYFQWFNMSEKVKYQTDHNVEPSSYETTARIIRDGLRGDKKRNKSLFVDLTSYEIKSNKSVAVFPIVPISPGDFLGTFPGTIHYTSQVPKIAIKGPLSGLWLDCSQVTGKLNQMKVAEVGDLTNVCLTWEGVNEVERQKFCEYFRVLVIATRHIMPFDQLVRPS